MKAVRKQKQADGGREVRVEAGPVTLAGILRIPEHANGIVLFAHGSGSSRFSPRNRYVAGVLVENHLATLLFDLLTAEEGAVDEITRAQRFDIRLLANRLVGATRWVQHFADTHGLPIGYFGASTGAAAALVAAAEMPEAVAAVVSRGGRPDLAGESLAVVRAPTLLIVGGNDIPVIEMNRDALERIGCRESKLIIVPGATHLFEEPGTLEEVARLAAEWLSEHFAPTSQKRNENMTVHR
ncbi:MAG: dienelactone hydrolase family protein [Acidobacteriota bacterium]|nr:dienelactone hydrolase family protein [Acidobacteriota bacterium]